VAELDGNFSNFEFRISGGLNANCGNTCNDGQGMRRDCCWTRDFRNAIAVCIQEHKIMVAVAYLAADLVIRKSKFEKFVEDQQRCGGIRLCCG
jgi:hypothetical protein